MASSKDDIVIKLRLEGQQELRKAFREINTAGKDLSKSFKDVGKALQDVGKNIAIVTAAVAGAATAVFALTKSNAQYVSDLADLGVVTGFSAESLQGIVFATRQVGNSSEDSLKAVERFTGAFGELQRTGEGPLKTALEGVDDALLNQLKSARSVEEGFDLLMFSMKNARSESEAYSLASAAGFGRRLAASITELALNWEGVGRATEAAKAAGAVLTDEQAKLNDDFISTLTRLRGAIGDSSRQFTTLLIPAFDSLGNTLRQFIEENTGAFLERLKPAIEEGTKVLLDFVKIFTEGGVFEGADERAVKLYANFILVKDSIVGAFQAAVEFGTAVFAALDPIAEILGMDSGLQLGLALLVTQFLGINNLVLSLVGLGKSLVTFFLALAGAIGPLVTTWFPGVVLGLKGMAAGFKVLAVAILTNPLFLIGAAIAAAVAVIAIIIDKTIGWAKAWDLVKAGISSVLEFLKNFVSTVVKVALEIGKAFVEGFVAATPGLQAFFKAAGDLVKDWIERAKEFFAGMGDNITDIFRGIGEAIGKVFEAVFQAIKSGVDALANSVVKVIDTIASAASKLFSRRTESSSSSSDSSEVTVQGFSKGGYVRGPGSTTGDKIPSLLSDEEFVIKAASVRKFGVPFFNALNNGVLPAIKRFAEGGLVTAGPSVSAPRLVSVTAASGSGGTPINLYLPSGEVIQARTDDEGVSVARKLEKDLRLSASAKASNPQRWYR